MSFDSATLFIIKLYKIAPRANINNSDPSGENQSVLHSPIPNGMILCKYNIIAPRANTSNSDQSENHHSDLLDHHHIISTRYP